MADQYHHGNLKSKLLEEAVTLISQDGLENLSLRRLATQCGVSHNAIYRHFDSKERLIDACRAYVMQELTRTLELTLSGLDESLPQTMEQLGTAYLDFYMRNPTYFSAYFRNASQKRRSRPRSIRGCRRCTLRRFPFSAVWLSLSRKSKAFRRMRHDGGFCATGRCSTACSPCGFPPTWNCLKTGKPV